MPPQAKLTHFLCIPLITPLSRPQLQSSLSAFIQNVTNKSTAENPNGIPEKAIRPLGTLHLTLGVMSLLDEERVKGALGVLKSLDLKALLEDDQEEGDGKGKGKETREKDASSSPQLHVTLRGLTSMHTPSKTSILYSSPLDPDQKLQTFCQRLRDVFITSGFIVPETRPLLLHATILNTVYVPGVRGKGSGHGKNKAKLTVDAREIMEDYEDYEWMRDVRVEKVAICRMGARKVEDKEGGEEYVVEGEVEIP